MREDAASPHAAGHRGLAGRWLASQICGGWLLGRSDSAGLFICSSRPNPHRLGRSVSDVFEKQHQHHIHQMLPSQTERLGPAMVVGPHVCAISSPLLIISGRASSSCYGELSPLPSETAVELALAQDLMGRNEPLTCFGALARAGDAEAVWWL